MCILASASLRFYGTLERGQLMGPFFPQFHMWLLKRVIKFEKGLEISHLGTLSCGGALKRPLHLRTYSQANNGPDFNV